MKVLCTYSDIKKHMCSDMRYNSTDRRESEMKQAGNNKI